MLSKIVLLVGTIQLVAGQTVTDRIPSFTTSSRTATSSCPVLCVDYVNPCGQMYGTCAPRCPGAPLPTASAPPCSKTTTVTTTTPFTPTTTTSSTRTSSCPTLCIDYLNSCGGMWGTCVPRCPGTPLPTYTPPPCTPRTTSVTTTPPPITTTTTTSSRTTTSCPRFCMDYTRPCGMWGTCFPYCPGGGMPTVSVPACPSTTTTTTTTTSSSRTTSCLTLCIDYINSCGGMWGTCVPSCSGTPLPQFTPPPCTPRSTTVSTTRTPSTTGYMTPVSPWAQCGGISYTGSTLCPSGYVCKVHNAYYSQCVPA